MDRRSKPRSAAEQLRMFLLREAHDAEFVLDLHCDSDSLLHIFTSPELMPELQDLADWMGAAAVLTAADSGGGSFDEVLPLLYRKVAQTNPGKPVPMASATATLEYRGLADSFDHYGEQDALRLFGFLAGRGLIAADPGPRPETTATATPFEATDVVRTPSAGLLAYRVDLGQRVQKGDPVAGLAPSMAPRRFLARTHAAGLNRRLRPLPVRFVNTWRRRVGRQDRRKAAGRSGAALLLED